MKLLTKNEKRSCFSSAPFHEFKSPFFQQEISCCLFVLPDLCVEAFVYFLHEAPFVGRVKHHFGHVETTTEHILNE